MAARLITINVRKYLLTQPETKRRYKAVSFVRERIASQMKSSPGKVRLSGDLNEAITKRFSRHMLPLRVSVTSEKDKISATLFSAAQEAAPKAEAKGARKAEGAKGQPAKQPEPDAKPAKADKEARAADNAKAAERTAPKAGKPAKEAAAPVDAPGAK